MWVAGNVRNCGYACHNLPSKITWKCTDAFPRRKILLCPWTHRTGLANRKFPRPTLWKRKTKQRQHLINCIEPRLSKHTGADENSHLLWELEPERRSARTENRNALIRETHPNWLLLFGYDECLSLSSVYLSSFQHPLWLTVITFNKTPAPYAAQTGLKRPLNVLRYWELRKDCASLAITL